MITFVENNRDIETYLYLRSKVNWKKLSPEQAQELNERSKLTVHTPAEAKELEDMGRGKVNNKSVDNGGESGIIKPDTLKMAASQQKPPDFSKYEVKADLEAVENMRGRISESLGIPLSDIDLDGIQMHILLNMNLLIFVYLTNY